MRVEENEPSQPCWDPGIGVWSGCSNRLGCFALTSDVEIMCALMPTGGNFEFSAREQHYCS